MQHDDVSIFNIQSMEKNYKVFIEFNRSYGASSTNHSVHTKSSKFGSCFTIVVIVDVELTFYFTTIFQN